MPTPVVSVISIRRALRALGRKRPEIVTIYLFGSRATGHAGPLSDVDVAVLTDSAQAAALKDPTRRVALVSDVMHACRRSDVDVVLLDEATPFLAYEIVSSGRLVYERDHQARVAFEAHALQRYLDLAPFLAVSRRYLKHQLLDGTYGG